MSATSVIAGTLVRTVVPTVRMLAAMSLSTEFLAPAMRTSPSRGPPPRTSRRVPPTAAWWDGTNGSDRPVTGHRRASTHSTTAARRPTRTGADRGGVPRRDPPGAAPVPRRRRQARSPPPVPTVTCRSTVSTAIADRLAAPRDSLVLEVDEGDGTYTMAEGPFTYWGRTLTRTPRDDGNEDVVEVTSFAVAAPVWGWLFVPPLRARIKRHHRRVASGEVLAEDGRPPVWMPPDRLDARAAAVLSTLCTLALLVGYLGTLITQTIAYAADQFGASTGDQSTVLATVRVGVLLSLGIVVLADRRGRRRLLIASLVCSCIAAAAGALATGMASLAVSQTISRAFSTSAVILLAIIAAEEMPRSSRAYAVGVMTLTGGLGAGVCVWFLPLAGTGPGGWRWLYVIPLIGLLPLGPLRGASGVPEVRPTARPCPARRSRPAPRPDRDDPVRGSALRGARVAAAERLPQGRAGLLRRARCALHPGHEHPGRHRRRSRWAPRRHARSTPDRRGRCAGRRTVRGRGVPLARMVDVGLDAGGHDARRRGRAGAGRVRTGAVPDLVAGQGERHPAGGGRGRERRRAPDRWVGSSTAGARWAPRWRWC